MGRRMAWARLDLLNYLSSSQFKAPRLMSLKHTEELPEFLTTLSKSLPMISITPELLEYMPDAELSGERARAATAAT